MLAWALSGAAVYRVESDLARKRENDKYEDGKKG